MKKISGLGPPILKESYLELLKIKFIKSISSIQSSKSNDKVNRNYYPYYIYKILYQIIPDSDVEQKRVLYYIYIQNTETVQIDDKEWELVCKELPHEFTYTPTDRNYALKFTPD
jgi:hypothetical protein